MTFRPATFRAATFRPATFRAAGFNTNVSTRQATVRNAAVNAAVSSQTSRIDQQITRADQRRTQTPPTYYRGGGQVQGLGGDPYRPRGVAWAGGTAIGSPVGNSQGQIATQPRAAGVATGAETGSGGNVIPVGYVTITNPTNTTIPIVGSAVVPLRIVELTTSFDSGGGDVAFSHEVGDTVEVGDRLTVTFANLSDDGGDPPEITASNFTASFKFG
jgi:hypothetical protein